MAARGGMAVSVVEQGSHGSTIDLALTEQERSELRLALRIYVTDLRTEISHTDRYEFREELKAKRAVLEEVLRRLGESTSATPEQETPRGGTVMADIVYLGMTVGFFALTWALIRLCERL
jgi:hypothetical protein